MKKFLISVVSLLVAIIAFGQEWQDVVYLKNGSIIRGIVLEQIPGQNIKIQTSDGNVFVYDTKDVERISKEQLSKSNYGNHNSYDFLDGELKCFMTLGNPWFTLNGRKIEQETAIALLGPSAYNEIKRYHSNWVGGDILVLASAGGYGFAFVSFLEGALNKNKSSKLTTGLIIAAVSTAMLIPGLIIETNNHRKTNEIIQKYNLSRNYSFVEIKPIKPLELNTQQPLAPAYHPVLSYTIKF